MKLLSKLFFGINMTWPKVIIFAVVTGVLTGVIMMIPQLEGTSIQNIGITMEAWILFAMIICSNCKKPLEAALKTFIFFLVSQPLVYLTMWPVYQSFPWHYYMYWFYWTIASFFCALLAWYVRKQNIGSALVVALINTLLLTLGIGGLRGVVLNFPFGLLTCVFCIAQAAVYVFVLLKPRRERLIAGIVSLVLALAISWVTVYSGPHSSAGFEYENAAECTYELTGKDVVTLNATSDMIDLTAKDYGEALLTVTRPDGTQEQFRVVVQPNGLIDVTHME